MEYPFFIPRFYSVFIKSFEILWHGFRHLDDLIYKNKLINTTHNKKNG